MYKRLIDLRSLATKRSFFLLGPRQTGKSTLLRQLFPKAHYVDLLEADTFRELSAHPEDLRQYFETAKKKPEMIIIDEIQKLPVLLDEVHLLMERYKDLRFILTGSSARKLRRGSVNLLAGRAWTIHLHPLVSPELGFKNYLRRLNYGSLPAIIDSEFPSEDLKEYVGTYLQEEIRAEGLTRSIENFSRLLQVAGGANGEQINFTSVANDVGMPARTVREHFQILEDTLIGYHLPAYQKTRKRKPVATAKFYFFDVGVANTLMKRSVIEEGGELFGRALEHLVFLELKAYLDYHRLDESLCYWRTHSQFEVDFVIGDHTAIEVKARPRVALQDQKGILALGEELNLKRKIIVSTERHPRKTPEGIEIVPYGQFFQELWRKEIF